MKILGIDTSGYANAIVIGEDGNMEDMGGALVQMAQINAGIATDLKPCPRI